MFAPLIDFIECQALYNMLNEGIEYAKISDPYFLYLLDCRSRNQYNESHIITSKNIKRYDDDTYRLPYESEIESRNTIVVYDGNTSSIEDNSSAIECAKVLSENGSKNTVRILKGGFQAISRFYPFLRTQQIIYMPRELDEIKTYPSEIIPGLLYLGNSRHGNEPHIKKNLKLRSFIDCTNQPNSKYEKTIDRLKIPLNDEPNESILEHLEVVCNFIETNIKDNKSPCLVFSDLGTSRSAAFIVAYMVYSNRLTLEEAFEKVNDCRKIQPQVKFLSEISEAFSNRSFVNN